MSPRSAIESLMGLLGAQRREARTRASLERETAEWRASSHRLDRLNDQIMHFPDGREPRPSGTPDMETRDRAAKPD